MRHHDFKTATDVDIGEPLPGYIEYQAAENFRDLCRIYGFTQARAIMAEIINDEASGKRGHGH